MNWKRALAAAVAAVFASCVAVYAGGLYQTWVGIGFGSYCASTVSGTGAQGGITGQGQGTTGSICGQTVPAGPPTFVGSEVVPVDIYTPGTQVTSGGAVNAFVTLLQLGQGPLQWQSTASYTSGATLSMVNNASFLILQGASNVTVGLPTTPVDGQIVHIVCTATTVVVVTVQAPTGQALLPTAQVDECGALATSGLVQTLNFRFDAIVSPTISANGSAVTNTSPTWIRF